MERVSKTNTSKGRKPQDSNNWRAPRRWFGPNAALPGRLGGGQMLPIPCSPPLFAPVFPGFLQKSPHLSNCCVWTPRGWINRSPRASATNRIIYSLHKSKATPAVPCIYLSFAYLFRKILAQPVLLRAWGTRKMERACIYHRFREVYVSYVSRNQLQPSQETGCIYGKSSCISVMVLRPQPATADGWLE